MKQAAWAFVLATVLTVAGAGAVHAQPPTTTPAPTPSQQLSPQSPGGGGSGEQIPIQDPKTGGVQWDKFGGDPANAPEDLDSFIAAALGWLRTLALACAVGGVLITAGVLMVGIRGRSEQAKKALHSLPVVLGATVLSGSAYTVIHVFL
ncbi:hypothetical protein SAMN05421776_11327 [Nocardia farcinica]|uniref:Integral membrane protein n=1 Tax=Nocardia farcinica TaxID=37329 RepID=A0A0H5PBH1_NOCFR|nr:MULTISPECIES: hypothetical protein [Nocardia]AXK89967.1 hypothetical protein DXT66_29695 [Nocardia farcinica]PFW99373.1 hypothetical protein CJ469_05293 [Nocardia farcinica]PFX06784.1 hypothetical protein CJ468_04184 [Nocardia farcinica]CRY84599.1 Uncharacterised protein [Nocardia farcinica]SIT32510.1 hypothetical protein SAMN05421776_11327 [Nocardia farcinica]